MIKLDDIFKVFSLWIDTVARIVVAPFERLKPAARIEVAEGEDGWFTLRSTQGIKGKVDTLSPHRTQITEGVINNPISQEWASALQKSRVELVLRPSHFLFRSLELPKRASEFLDGIVRAQIDRLTPWNARDAVFHWSRPADIAGDRITTTVVATARAIVTSLAQSLADLGAAAVEVSTVVPGSDGARVTVYAQKADMKQGFGRIRLVLLSVFAVTGILAILSIGAGGFVGSYYDDQRQSAQRRVAERRALIRSSQSGESNSAVELLERRKQATPSSVMVIEALSALLPDHTYTTEVRIEGDKLQIIGITRDAPSLIPILEQSPHFTRATFFAPTTRAPNDPGERFHIEVRMKPHFGSGT
jgi:general secretion pathway protein L